jgi:site-specific DNA recombinase
LYAEGNQTLESIAVFLKSKGITTKSGKQLTKDQIKRILVNPFYYGHFRYAAKYTRANTRQLSKKLFDRVQTVIAKRCHPQKGATAPQVFCGLLTCATCNMAITAEKKIKHQKNGNTHEYIYYRCTRKSKSN